MTQSGGVQSQAIGSYLRWQRELREISIEELAESTRIPVRSIERLEAGFFDGQADGFVKGFVRTVSDGLGLDAEDTLSRMLSEPVPEDRRLTHLKRRFSGALLGLAVLSLLGMLIFVVQQLSTRQSRSLAEAQRQIIFREDPVRVLAESQPDSVLSGAPTTGSPELAAEPQNSD